MLEIFPPSWKARLVRDKVKEMCERGRRPAKRWRSLLTKWKRNWREMSEKLRMSFFCPFTQFFHFLLRDLMWGLNCFYNITFSPLPIKQDVKQSLLFHKIIYSMWANFVFHLNICWPALKTRSVFKKDWRSLERR